MLQRRLIPVLMAPALVPPAQAQTARPTNTQPNRAPPAPAPGPAVNWRGANITMVERFPLGSAEARRSLRLLASLGVDSVAFTPFLWQPAADSVEVVRGNDLPDPVLVAGIQQAKELGLRVLVKPHLWVQGARQGEARMGNDNAWRRWFSTYNTALVAMARVAQEAGADAMAIGTALPRAAARPEWRGTIEAMRGAFRGRLTYVATDSEEAETFPHWPALDAIGVRIFRPLGPDDRPEEWAAPMQREAERLDRLAERHRKRVWVAELGVRSAASAAANPALSAEERPSIADQRVQAEVIARWLRRLDRPSVEGVFLWRWFSDPTRGGPDDTDFTFQNKLAEGVLLHAWLTR